MGFSVGQLRAVYDAAQSNDCLLAQITEERDRLALEVAMDPDAGREVISGSANGLSFTATVTMSKGDRLAFLNAAVKHITDGVPPSSVVYSVF